MFFKRILSIILVLLVNLLLVVSGFASVSATVNYEQYADNLEKTSYEGELGAIYSKGSTTFKVWAPNSDVVKVRLFKKGSAEEGSSNFDKEITMKKDKDTGVWSVNVKGDLKNIYYTYYIERDKKSFETSDIYAKACGVNGERSMVVDLKSTNPENWNKDKNVMVSNFTDAKIWEIQIADFSSSKTSGVSKEHRGKYLAFTESGTTVSSISGNPSTCVDYLKQLGINYVHINPFYDFGSIDETDTSGSDDNYNWGYDPVNYNVPEGSYSSNPYDGNIRIKECKQMIQALHNAGIGVVMDVVYNHTQKSEDSNFNKTVPDYYYRLNSDGSFSNGSGCGNDTASERKMYRKYMIDSVYYWAKEYHIDGFRFDLMGLHDVETMNQIRSKLDKLPNGKKILMYGEPWNLTTTCDSDCTLSNQKNVSKLNERIAIFNDNYRDSIKGSTNGIDKGFLQSGSDKSALKVGIGAQTDSIMGWVKKPIQIVTYASCHDNLTLWDKLVKSVKGSNADFYKRYSDVVAMNKLAGAITYTSQGISFILAGEEFSRTKNGDHNSYSSGFAINQIDWSNLETYGDVSSYYKGLIQIRNTIKAFTDATAKSANSIKYIEDVPTGVLAYTIDDSKFGKVCVIFNSSDKSATVNATGNWVVLANEEVAGVNSLGEVSDKIDVAPISATVLVNKDKYDKAKVTNNQGKVVVRYYCNNEIFKSYVLDGEVGTEYDINPSVSVKLDYKITKSTGNQGSFAKDVQYCDFYCESLPEDTSNVIFNFVDSKTDKNICESIVLTNKNSEYYLTPAIPSIDEYSLDLEKLPTNSCGSFAQKDTVVTYYYNKTTSSQSECKVNVIYMSTDGKVLDTQVIKGEENASFVIEQKDISSYKFLKSTDEVAGKFTQTEQNIICFYEETSNLPLILFIVFLSVAAVIIVITLIYLNKKKQNNLMKNLDIS